MAFEAEEGNFDDICETLVANVFDKDKIQSQLHELHIQMAHPPMDRMISRIKTAKAWDKEMQQIVEDIYASCCSKSCRARNETQFVRKFAFRHAQKLGDLEAVNLKIRSAKGKGWDILYMLDHATSFIFAEFNPNKKPEAIARVLNNMWYARSFPYSKTLLSDNGNGFNGSPMIEVLEMLNVKHEVTAGFTPQQNGLVERIHAIVDLNMEMLMDGSTIGEEEALSMAVNAYNQMELKSGVSPSFLVYNVATTFPSILNIAPTSLENVIEELPRSLGDLI